MTTADQPLSTATVADWEDAKAYLAEHTNSRARHLDALTAHMGDEYHQLVLDPQTRTIWWAWDRAADEPTHQEDWTIDQLTPQAAANMLDDYIDIIEDRMEDPGQYAYGSDPDHDQEAMDEYADILRLMLPDDPADAARMIRRKRQLISRRDARWQRTYANMTRDLTGTERGGKTRAAAAIGVSDMQVGRIIREDDQRRRALANAAKKVRTTLREANMDTWADPSPGSAK
jgi:hypothetical protein